MNVKPQCALPLQVVNLSEGCKHFFSYLYPKLCIMRLSKLIVMILIVGSLCVTGCEKIGNDDEGLLESSKPIYNMLFEISVHGLYLTEWSATTSSYSLLVKFDRTQCNFIYADFLSGQIRSERFSYSYDHPVATLTPVTEGNPVLTGTTISGRVLAADEISFVDDQGMPVLMKLTRKK